jgi:hypothetical protein
MCGGIATGWGWAFGWYHRPAGLIGAAIGTALGLVVMAFAARLVSRLLEHRYRIVIVGRESGNRTPLDFVTFRTPDEACAWILKMAKAWPDRTDLTYYEWEAIPRER